MRALAWMGSTTRLFRRSICWRRSRVGAVREIGVEEGMPGRRGELDVSTAPLRQSNRGPLFSTPVSVLFPGGPETVSSMSSPSFVVFPFRTLTGQTARRRRLAVCSPSAHAPLRREGVPQGAATGSSSFRQTVQAFFTSASFWAAACCSQTLAFVTSAVWPATPLASSRPSLRCASARPVRAARSYQSAAWAPSCGKPPLAGSVGS